MKDQYLADYYLALDRITSGKTSRVKAGEKITLRLVALEAGKTAGAIKKSRPIYSKLILTIGDAANAQNMNKSFSELKIEKLKNELVELRRLYAESIGREAVLMSQLLDR